MSTDLRDPASKQPGDGPTPDEKPKPALSLTQVVGGALAAMTAAFLGSRLSVAGTVVGAALASVVAAVAGAVYTSSIRRTSQTVSTVWRTVVRPDGRGGTETVTEEVTPDGTVVSPTVEDSPTSVLAAEASEPDGPSTHEGVTPAGTDRPAGRRIGWKPVAATAVLIFAIAAVALTGFELATGSALSGGSGTTVGRVAEDRTDPAPKATGTPSSSAEPSESASSEPTAAPTPSDEATPSQQATAAPTAEPTAEPTPTVGSGPTPSASAAPSSSAAEPTAAPSAAGGATP
jgi:hypothetical protein